MLDAVGCCWVTLGVISMKDSGAEPPLLKLLIILGGSAPKMLLHCPCFSKFIDLASKVFPTAMINCAIATWLLRHF